MYGLNEKIIKDLVDICKEDKNIKKMRIFGSRVVGEFNPGSDVEIAVDVDDKTQFGRIKTNIDNLGLLYKFVIVNAAESTDERIKKESAIIYERGEKSNFITSVNNLRKVKKPEELSDLEMDGLMQRYEISFELAWKLIREYLINQKVLADESVAPRLVLQEALEWNVIDNHDVWKEMLDNRYEMAIVYNDRISREKSKLVKEKYLPELEKLVTFFEGKL